LYEDPSNQYLDSKVYVQCLHSLTVYSKLDPVLSEANLFDLIKTATDCVFPLPTEGGASPKKGKGDNLDPLEMEVLMEATVEALDELLIEILTKDCTPDGLDSIIKVEFDVQACVYKDCHVLLTTVVQRHGSKAGKVTLETEPVLGCNDCSCAVVTCAFISIRILVVKS